MARHAPSGLVWPSCATQGFRSARSTWWWQMHSLCRLEMCSEARPYCPRSGCDYAAAPSAVAHCGEDEVASFARSDFVDAGPWDPFVGVSAMDAVGAVAAACASARAIVSCALSWLESLCGSLLSPPSSVVGRRRQRRPTSAVDRRSSIVVLVVGRDRRRRSSAIGRRPPLGGRRRSEVVGGLSSASSSSSSSPSVVGRRRPSVAMQSAAIGGGWARPRARAPRVARAADGAWYPPLPLSCVRSGEPFLYSRVAYHVSVVPRIAR